MARNKLIDLNNHLFEQIERLNDEELSGDELQKEIERSNSMASVAKVIVDNAALIFEVQNYRDALGKKNVPDVPDVLKIDYRAEETDFARDKRKFLDKMERDFRENSDSLNWKSITQKKYYLEYQAQDDSLKIVYLLKGNNGAFATTNKGWLEGFMTDNKEDIKKYVFGVVM